MSSNAVKKVFAIPELLENILLHTREALRNRLFSSSRPEKGLFRLLRVNRSFKTTIEGSAELQRFMFMAPLGPTATATRMHNHDEYGPIVWLTDLLAEYCDAEYTEEPSQLDYILYPISTTSYSDDEDEQFETFSDIWQRFHRFRSRHNEHHEASWRQMRLLLLPNCELTIRFTVCLGNNDQVETMRVRWKFSADQKLGEFYDRWERLLEALQPQAQQYNELNAQRTREDAELAAKGRAKLSVFLD